MLRTNIRTLQRVCLVCRISSGVFVTIIIDLSLGGPLRIVYEGWDNGAGLCGYLEFHNQKQTHTHTHTEDQCEWHRMTRMTGPDCAVMCNLINNTHTHTHTQGTLSLSKNCTSRESVSPLSRLIRGFRNKYH